MDDLIQEKLGGHVIEHYTAPQGVIDELRDNTGSLRPEWTKFLNSVDRIGSVELRRRWAQTQQLIRDNGIAYGAYVDAGEQTRPWDLDAIPVLINQAEWQTVDAGLQQRMRLLELALSDLYGPQRLISEGILPAEILFANPGHWRAYHGHQPPSGTYLRLYAADMARAPDGAWWILADRCEAPSGLGFALENRVILSRMLPSVFRECRVQRLAPFFKTLQDTLRSISPRQRDNPRIAIFTEGPTSENYFEDAYLARYLGYTLVEGADLTVRDQRLFLKTLGGLLPIDVMVRRADSASCDPLELQAHSSNGVVGLLQAARAGSMAICNSLGSGLVESPVFMAFMPRLCDFFLGEQLILPGVATWWCGERGSLDYVVDRLGELTIKRAFRDRARERVITRQIRDMPHADLAAMIRADPLHFVAQERVDRSAVPLWRGQQCGAAHLALRTYVVAGADGYQVLTGGLARTSTVLTSLETSLIDGEGSKDTWILSDEPVEPMTLLPRPGQPLVELKRSGADLPSRVADDVFWLGRYVERADSAARLLRTVTLRLTSETDFRSLPELPFLLRAMVAQGQIEPGYVVEGIKQQLPEIDQALPKSAMDVNEAGSLRSILDSTLRIAAKVRDRLSLDSWRILVTMEERFEVPDNVDGDLTGLLNLANDVILGLAAFSGTIMESTTRTQAFRFLEIGRRLERAMQLVDLFENCFLGSTKIPFELLEAVLETDASLMTYRSRYMANLQLSAVLDLLLTDETNPRSLAFQLVELEKNVLRLPKHESSESRSHVERLAMTMLHDIRMINVKAISEDRSLNDCRPLERLLLNIAKKLPLLSHAISHQYLVHSGPSRQLQEITPDDVVPPGEGSRS